MILKSFLKIAEAVIADAVIADAAFAKAVIAEAVIAKTVIAEAVIAEAVKDLSSLCSITSWRPCLNKKYLTMYNLLVIRFQPRFETLALAASLI